MKLVPSKMSLKPQMENFEYFFEDIDKDGFASEIHQWFILWKGKDSVPSNLVEAAAKCDTNYFPNLKRVLQICATFPVASCECERSISVLRLLKTYLRSSMGQDRLSSLALMYVHRDIPINKSEIVHEFGRLHPRRLLLPNLLSDA